MKGLGKAWACKVCGAVLLACASACALIQRPEGPAWLQESRRYSLAPATDWVAPAAVVRTEGRVDGA